MDFSDRNLKKLIKSKTENKKSSFLSIFSKFFSKKNNGKEDKKESNSDGKKSNELNTKLIKSVGFGVLIITVIAFIYGMSGGGSSSEKKKENRDIVSASKRFDITDADRQKVTDEDADTYEQAMNEITLEEINRTDDLNQVERGHVQPVFTQEQPAYVVQNGQQTEQIQPELPTSLFPDSSPNKKASVVNSQNDKESKDIMLAQSELDKIAQKLQSGVMTTNEENQAYINSMAADYDYVLNTKVNTPISPYQIMQGTVIPIILITGINSDLPGMISGRVLQDVYNTVDGRYLIIPAGSMVVGNYSSSVAWGQKRVMVAWERLIRPDGSSVNLKSMSGVDFAGYAGYSDKVDNHYGQLAGLLVISTLMNLATGQITYLSDKYSSNDTTTGSLAASGSDSAADVTEVINEMAEKYLNLAPTLTIRAGTRAALMVNKDIILPPYGGGVR